MSTKLQRFIEIFRGNNFYTDEEGVTRYCDDDTSTVENWETKPCGKCGLGYTKEGHDGCLGTLTGNDDNGDVINACCGHGFCKEAYVHFADLSIIEGEEAIEYQEKNKQINK